MEKSVDTNAYLNIPENKNSLQTHLQIQLKIPLTEDIYCK